MVEYLTFTKTQRIMQKPGEDYRDLHERIRGSAVNSSCKRAD